MENKMTLIIQLVEGTDVLFFSFDVPIVRPIKFEMNLCIEPISGEIISIQRIKIISHFAIILIFKYEYKYDRFYAENSK